MSTDGHLQEFKKGAFRIAIDNQMDVLPVTIHGTFEARSHAPFLYGGRAIVIVHEPISVQGLTPVDITRVKNEAYTAIRSGLVELGVDPSQEPPTPPEPSGPAEDAIGPPEATESA